MWLVCELTGVTGVTCDSCVTQDWCDLWRWCDLAYVICDWCEMWLVWPVTVLTRDWLVWHVTCMTRNWCDRTQCIQLLISHDVMVLIDNEGHQHNNHDEREKYVIHVSYIMSDEREKKTYITCECDRLTWRRPGLPQWPCPISVPTSVKGQIDRQIDRYMYGTGR